MDMKTCKKCNQTKTLDLFVKAKWCSDGVRNICKDCRNRCGRKHYQTNKEEYSKDSRALGLKKSYWPELSKDEALIEYDKLLKSQDHKCAICQKHESSFKKPLFVDHCHKSKKVRGLLCRSCNLGIGFLKADSSTKLLESSISYIQKSQSDS